MIGTFSQLITSPSLWSRLVGVAQLANVGRSAPVPFRANSLAAPSAVLIPLSLSLSFGVGQLANVITSRRLPDTVRPGRLG